MLSVPCTCRGKGVPSGATDWGPGNAAIAAQCFSGYNLSGSRHQQMHTPYKLKQQHCHRQSEQVYRYVRVCKS